MGLFSILTGKQASRSSAAKRDRDSKSSEYRGVQINADRADACAEVRAIVGQRFLSDEVPMLPLDGCDAVTCKCTYELYDDRRTDVRRCSDVSYDIAGQYLTHDKRSKPTSGRRSDD